MKTLEELGISPVPWTADNWNNTTSNGAVVAYGASRPVTPNKTAQMARAEETANARLAAAAPELYEALREAYEDFPTCFGDGECGACPCGDTCEKWSAKARAALEKAGGAE